MKIRGKNSLAVVALFSGYSLLAVPVAAVAQQPKADNTGVNERDRAPSEPTADKQKNNRTDLEITQSIRRALVADKSLSTYAHNVKIVTQNGKVTLKGPVRSDAERAAIQAKAAEVAGAANITDALSVVPAKSSSKKTS